MSAGYKVIAEYKISKKSRGIYIRNSVLNKLRSINADKISSILYSIVKIRDFPATSGHEILNYKLGFNIHVFHDSGFSFIYFFHKPSSGPFMEWDWLVHVVDVDEYYLDEDGDRVLRITEDPDVKRTLAERDGEIID